MARWLNYTAHGRGHLFPIVPTLQELRRRGHEVVTYVGSADVELIREQGLEAHAVDPRLEAVEHTGHEARTRLGEVRGEVRTFARKSAHVAADLEAAIARHRPDALLVDSLGWGAMAAAQASGLPWATYTHSVSSLKAPGIPPYGLGLMPRTDLVGRARDAVVRSVIDRLLESVARGPVNAVREARGLEPVRDAHDLYVRDVPLALHYTAEPFEYGREWPENVRLVGPGLWDPASETPAWLDGLPDPLVLVSTSSLFQDDVALARTALEVLPGHVGSLVVTTAGYDPDGLPSAPNARVERFVAHAPVIERAAVVVSHAGMGITQKALAAGVPVVSVPFGRDQFDVARRVELSGGGVRLPAPRLNGERLVEAVRTAMGMRAGAERLAAAFAAAGGPLAAVDALEELAGVAVPVPA